jgi:prepilin-type N-terminal cleavage/methylation domain-containing protein
MTFRAYPSSTVGMSLIELLAVVSVLGIVTAVALPNLASVSSHAYWAKDEKNAQNIASLLASAKAAGAPNSWTNVDDAIEDLHTGISVQMGNGQVTLGISEMSEEERERAANLLQVSDGMVYYHPVTQE